MFEVLRHLNYAPGGDGFRYSYYNDWGNADDTEFAIYTNYESKRLTAHLELYRGSVMYLIMHAYDKGARTRDAMLKVIPRNEYDADVAACPKIQIYFDELKKQFMARVNTPHEPQQDIIYTDSPPVYHYDLDIGNRVTANLSLLDEQGPLYKATQETMDYVKSCGKLTKKPEK